VVWSEAVLNRADIFFATLELDLRSAQDAMRFIKALRAEDLPLEKIQYVMNRAPGGMDLTGKGRVKKLAESLGVEIKTLLPDGGKAVQEAGDNGQPLPKPRRRTRSARKSKLAQGLHKAMPPTPPQPNKPEHPNVFEVSQAGTKARRPEAPEAEKAEAGAGDIERIGRASQGGTQAPGACCRSERPTWRRRREGGQAPPASG
jgi:Flp pilus assembly CpaE family ATPase